jgi:eukaryotic-like serine/threonine-protein kinase
LLKALNDGAQSRPYIVMEPLKARLCGNCSSHRRRLPSARVEKIALGICDVLEYVENHGVAHRDIRPENILVGADDQVKLINFGTAAMVGARRITFANLAQSVGFRISSRPKS